MSKIPGKQIAPVFTEDVHCPELYADVKHFAIKHPSKEGHMLIHSSLEGPENAVYARGKAFGRVVMLPEYWSALVDPTTVTVTLTPYGAYQELYVEAVHPDRLVVNTMTRNVTMNYHWVAVGERRDIPSLVHTMTDKAFEENMPSNGNDDN